MAGVSSIVGSEQTEKMKFNQRYVAEMPNLAKGMAAFEAGNYTVAFEILKPIADRGEAEPQCMIANMYHLGLGIEMDMLEAVKWYRKSAEQGYGVASNNLAGILEVGYGGIEVDRTEAKKLRKQSREQGFLHGRR